MNINERRAEIRENAKQEVRQRVKAIVTHPAAQANYEEAKRLALETDLPAEQAIERLQARQTDATIKRAGEILGNGGNDNG